MRLLWTELIISSYQVECIILFHVKLTKVGSRGQNVIDAANMLSMAVLLHTITHI